MEIKKTKQDTLEIVEVIGKVDANNSKDFEIALANSFDEGNIKVLLDFSKLDYISSSGLRVLLSLAKKVSSSGLIYLCSLQPQVSQIFTISGFGNIFTIFDDREIALKIIS